MAGWQFYLNGTEVEEPIGWDAIEFTAIRMESHGIDQPFSTEVRFYGKGAKLIKALYDQYFINADIDIVITSDVGYNGQAYQFEGKINLAIYQEHNVCDTDSWEITVGIIDDNFREQFKARQDVEVDLKTITDLNGDPIDPLAYDNIRLHKQQLYLTAQAKNLAQKTMILAYDLTFGWQLPTAANNLPTYFQNNDFKGPYGSALDIQFPTFAYTNSVFTNNSSYARSITFNIDIAGSFFGAFFNPGDSANISLYIGSYNGVIPSTLVKLYDSALWNDGDSALGYSTIQNYTITVPSGENVLLYLRWGTDGSIAYGSGTYAPPPPILTVYVDSLCVILSETNEGLYASECAGLKIENYLKRLIYIMTGSNDKLLSDAFSETGNGCYWNNFLTNGVRIRQAPTILQIQNGCTSEDPEDQQIFRTSFKSIFDGLDKIFCLGWAFEWTGTEWKIRIEPREYFYQDSISQSFENVGEVNQMAMADKLINNIRLGYDDKWKNISLSGMWAIHTDRNYFVANKAMAENSSAKLDLLSNIICEGYAIEFSRRLIDFWDDSGSSDRPNDYNIFLIWLNRNEVSYETIEDSCFVIPNETGAKTFSPGQISMPSSLISFSGSPLNNLYNIFHTPARVALRWWKVLGMHTYGLTNPVLQFQVGQYQTTYYSQIDDANEPCQQYLQDDPLYENVSISATVLRAGEKEYLFKPIGIEFSYPQSLCDFLTLSQDEQYRKVRLTSGSLDVQGFITEATNQPEDASGGTTKFTLLMAATASGIGGAYSDGFSTGFDNGE